MFIFIVPSTIFHVHFILTRLKTVKAVPLDKLGLEQLDDIKAIPGTNPCLCSHIILAIQECSDSITLFLVASRTHQHQQKMLPDVVVVCHILHTYIHTLHGIMPT